MKYQKKKVYSFDKIRADLKSDRKSNLVKNYVSVEHIIVIII